MHLLHVNMPRIDLNVSRRLRRMLKASGLRALLLTLPVKCAHDHHACLVYTHISQLG
jgi:hypothetical protein